MATPSEAYAVKSLNKSSGRKRFIFKSFAQRVAEVDINVYRSLDPLKSEPSEGSSFFRDCLVEWRELNTAEGFISFYEEVFPLVQTLPQIILQKELIISKLLARLQMNSRLSLEPILSLVAALSRDIVDDFLPFLPRIVDSLVFLLKSGAEREPEIMEQIFTSWSCIMMYMQKYLIKDLAHLLKVTLKLRFYPKDYVQEFVAESVSFIFRNASLTQLMKGIRKVLREVAMKPSPPRKFGISELLRYTMRGSASRLHSRAIVVLRLLLDKSSFEIGAQVGDGSDSILEVLALALSKLNEELEPKELNLVWDCLLVEVSDAVVSDCLIQISPLLSLLISASQNRLLDKISDYQPVLQLARSLVLKFITPHSEEGMNHPTEVIDKVLKLLLCILDGLYSVNDMQAISDVSLDWAPIFSLHNSSLISFLEVLLFKDVSVLLVFKIHIIRALDDLLQVSEAAVMNLFLILLDKLQISTSGFLEGTPRDIFSRVRCYISDVFDSWIQTIKSVAHGNLLSLEVDENKLAILWAAITCYPYVVDGQENLSLLVDLLNALDGLLMIKSEYSKNTWQSLIGALLKSHMKIILGRGTGMDESEIGKFMGFAEKYHSSSQILSAVADFLDSVCGLMTEEQVKTYHLERKSFDALERFSGNLCHSSELLRLSSLRILRHYGSLNILASCEQPDENKVETGDSETGLTDQQGGNVLEVLLLIESTPHSIDTSRRVNLLLSRLQMSVSAGKVAKRYVPALLYGVIGIFHKRFSYIWNPAMECLSVLISQHFGSIWDRFFQYLDSCQSVLVLSHGQSCRIGEESHNKAVDLVGRFNAFVAPFSDNTPCASVFLLLIRSLQKVSSLVESRTRQIVPLFLKFLGYDLDNLTSVEVYNLQKCKGKEWKEALKEWLSLFRLMRNPKSFFLGQFLKEVFLYRLLDDNDAEQQTRVFDCLLNWKDEFLLPYSTHLRNLIISKNLREELTTWSLSRESNLIDGQHRTHVVPIVIRILVPKVRKIKTLTTRKHSSVHHRRAILGFLAQLETDELSLLFELLIFPLRTAAEGANANGEWVRTSQPSTKDEFNSLSILKLFTGDGMKHISWKKLYSFLHVIIEVLQVFDEWHISPFLDLLLGSVVRVLDSCTKSLDCLKSNESSLHDPSCDSSIVEHGGETKTKIMTSTRMKQFRELRSLSLKIISLALQKYESYDFGYDFWECFFVAVKPLIISFKQEGASSEKPNSLFSCFLTMSRSLKFAPLLSREKNLVPDIFSIIMVPTASDAVVSAVLNLVENLLTLDSEVGEEDSPVKKMLLSHLDVLLFSLHNLFTRDRARQRMLVQYRGDKGLVLFKLLSKYVKEPSAATKFIEILLPLLEKRPKDSDLCISVLQIIRNVVPFVGSEISEKVISSLSPLLTSVGLEIRLSICDVFNSLAQSDSSVLIVAKMLSELNASSGTDIDGLDYDTITGAYEKINSDFFYKLKKGHALILLSHSIYDMSSEEMILRQSAYGMLLSFVVFSSEILTIKGKSDRSCWSEACVQQVLCKFLLNHMGNAMPKETAIQKGWIDLLREMVLKVPMVANLESYRHLYSQDPEQDFFSNIVHLQKHRRARALSKFIHVFSSYSMSEVITNKVFVPLFFNTLLELHQGKGENIRSACLEALGLVAGCMSWKQYRALLMRCFREMNIKRDKQKVLLRLICSILDHFHFSRTELSPEAIGYTESNQTSETCGISAELVDIQAFLQGLLLSRIQGLMSSSSDNLNVNVCLVALKLLKLLPREMMDSRLPTIIHRICSFLKNRLESVRDEARSAMAACLQELGLEYLQVMVHAMKSILKRGYELHVLGFSMHFLLSKFLVTPSSGKLDYCLDDLLSVTANDIFGDVSEQKDVEKIASKMKETRKQKSYDTLKLIAQSITFRTHALKLLLPVTVHLQKQLTPKVKLKLESMLNHIATGIECNPSVNKTDLFIFVYRLIKEGIGDESYGHESAFSSKTEKQDGGEVHGQISNPNRLIRVDPRYSHLVTAFGLRLLQNYMKLQLREKDEDLLSLLDPFVSLLCDCLGSKYENIVSAAVRCLSPLIGLPLASLESQANKIKNSLMVIAQGSGNAGSPLMESCLRLLMLLLRSTKITLSADQLHMLIQFPLFIDIERNPSFVALSLLKAIVNRKLVVPEVYDVVKRVAELMVTSQVESVRKKCSQILLQFLLDYHLSEKRLQEHLDFLLANLRYEHSTGREAVLEMLHAIILKFPASVIDEQSQTLFVHLVVCLSNDYDPKVRSMTGAAIKLLIGRVSSPPLHSILEYSLSWYLGEQKHLWSAAAQVLGLLVEVMKKGFQKYNIRVLTVIQRILQSSLSAVSNSQDDTIDGEAVPLWKEAYYSLVLVEKLLVQFERLYFDKDLEEMWESICDLLLHPHLWLRNITNRLIGLYLAHAAEACTDTSFMIRPGRLFLIAASLCCQLRASPNDDTACTFIMQNLVFSIYHLHSLLCQRGRVDFPKFWFSLDISEQQLFLRAFQVLDPKKGRSLVAYLTSGLHDQQYEQNTEAQRHFLVSYLLKKMGKLSFQVESMQMKIIFNCFRLLSQKFLRQRDNLVITLEDNPGYAYQMLLPLYRVCEGYAGKVISDDMKQSAQEVCDSIRDDMGMQNFVQVYSKIRKDLKLKRDKRKQQQKLLAVVNPMRNAKRKLRTAEKKSASKRRKIMTLKMGRWMR